MKCIECGEKLKKVSICHHCGAKYKTGIFSFFTILGGIIIMLPGLFWAWLGMKLINFCIWGRCEPTPVTIDWVLSYIIVYLVPAILFVYAGAQLIKIRKLVEKSVRKDISQNKKKWIMILALFIAVAIYAWFVPQ